MQLLDKSKRIIKSTAVTGTVAALTLVPASALAHGGGQDNGSRNDSKNASAHQVKHKDNSRNDWWNRNKNRQKLTCSERQDALNKKAADAKARYTQRLKGMGIVYSGIQAYVSGGVTVPDYDALDARVTADQTNATNAVNAIAAPQLNCDDQNSAAAMSDDDKTFHDHDKGTDGSINAAQKAVNAYRKSLNELFEAVINS